MNKKKDYTDSKKIIGVKRSSRQGKLLQKKPAQRHVPIEEDSHTGQTVYPDESQCFSPKYSFSTEIPERYNETYIAAIPKDPDSLFVYWEFSDETVKLMHTMMDQIGSKIILRVQETESTDVDDDIISFHVEINKQQEEYLLKIPERGKKYQVECGHFTENGEFVQLAQSDPIMIPFAHSEMQMFDPIVDPIVDTLECVPETMVNSTISGLQQMSLQVKKTISICNSQVCNSLSHSSTIGSAAHF